MKKFGATGVALTGLVALTAAMLATASTAAAADQSVSVNEAQGTFPPFDWNRCYFGAHGAYGWGTNQNDFNKAIASDPTEGGEGFPAEFASFDHNTKGWGLGAQAGCDFQFSGAWLVGAEGEFMWSNINGQHTNPEDGSDPGDFSRFKSDNRWDADIALRLGHTWSQDLLYGKVGAVFGNFRYRETHDDFPTTHACGGTGTCSVSESDTRTGLLLGVGWEHAWNANWTTKIEYNYDDFGSTNISYPDAAAAIKHFKVSDTKNIIKIGVNFYFP
jgi:outer membrane immunogenic protein